MSEEYSITHADIQVLLREAYERGQITSQNIRRLMSQFKFALQYQRAAVKNILRELGWKAIDVQDLSQIKDPGLQENEIWVFHAKNVCDLSKPHEMQMKADLIFVLEDEHSVPTVKYTRIEAMPACYRLEQRADVGWSERMNSVPCKIALARSEYITLYPNDFLEFLKFNPTDIKEVALARRELDTTLQEYYAETRGGHWHASPPGPFQSEVSWGGEAPGHTFGPPYP